MPSPLPGFFAGSVLAAADLGLLALFTRSLGRSASGLGLLALMVMLKLALLALGVAWICRQPWNDRPAMLAGLILPFFLFIGWQALRLHLRARRGA